MLSVLCCWRYFRYWLFYYTVYCLSQYMYTQAILCTSIKFNAIDPHTTIADTCAPTTIFQVCEVLTS